MKKLFMTTLTIIACGAVYALPVGNPSDAGLLCDGLVCEGHCGDPSDPCLTWCDGFSVRFGFYGDYVFNRHMELENGPHSVIEHTKINTNAGFIAANFWDRFDIFATLGASNLFIDTNNQAFGLGGTGRFEIETETDFSWSIGARGIVWEFGCTTLGAEAQYFYTNPHITRLTQNATTSVYPGGGFNAKYYEWQVGLGISHRIYMLVPYAAIKASNSKLDFGNHVVTGFTPDATLHNLRSDKYLGYALGVSFVDCEKMSLTVEGRFADEKALYTNCQIRF